MFLSKNLHGSFGLGDCAFLKVREVAYILNLAESGVL